MLLNQTEQGRIYSPIIEGNLIIYSNKPYIRQTVGKKQPEAKGGHERREEQSGGSREGGETERKDNEKRQDGDIRRDVRLSFLV